MTMTKICKKILKPHYLFWQGDEQETLSYIYCEIVFTLIIKKQYTIFVYIHIYIWNKIDETKLYKKY